MAFDPVPFFVGGGAQHSADIMRTMAYLATGGLEGIVGPFDLRVTQDSPPGGSVLVLPGTGVAVSKYPSVTQESYVFKNRTATAHAIAPTPSNAGRSDLIIARVRDPSVGTSSDPAPVSVANGPYVGVETITGVPATTKSVHQITPSVGATAITLARIDIPANTGTITDAMIKDLRSTANTAVKPAPAPEAEGSNEAEATLFKVALKCTGSMLDDDETTFKNWPAEAVWTNVLIPKWCTHIAFFAIMNPRISVGDFFGEWRLTFDGVATASSTIDINYEFSALSRPLQETLIHGGVYVVPASQRGKFVTLRTQGRSANSALNGQITAHAGCYMRVELDFMQIPSAS